MSGNQRRRAQGIQHFADRKIKKKFHDALKTIGGKTILEPPYCSVQMEALFLQMKMISWRSKTEFFVSVLNRPSCITDNDSNRISQKEFNALLDVGSTGIETKIAVQ